MSRSPVARPQPAPLGAALGWAVLLIGSLACRSAMAPLPPRLDLEGLRVPLATPGLDLVVQGRVGAAEAYVVLAFDEPLSRVDATCFPDGAPTPEGTVRIPSLGGGHRELGEIWVEGARVGDRPLRRRIFGLWPSERGCRIVLGSDVLAGYALRLDPRARTLTFRRSASLGERRAPDSPGSGKVIPLTRSPRADAPLLPARLRRGSRLRTETFALSPRTPSRIASSAAGGEGTGSWALSGIELAPGADLGPSALLRDERWRSPLAIGALGPDLWGRSLATVDLGAGELILDAPAEVRDCQAAKALEARCVEVARLEVHQTQALMAMSWAPLPTGARLELELLAGDGSAVEAPCELSVSFGLAAAGTSTVHPWPWGELTKLHPGCAEALRAAAEVRLGSLQEGPEIGCVGHCLVARVPGALEPMCRCEDEARVEALWRAAEPRRRKDFVPYEDEPEPEDHL